jgi:RecA/RadA recombinase
VSDAGTGGNPFISRRIRPGAIAFLFPRGQSLDAVLEGFRQQGRCGEIVGPHGCGKSTLWLQLIARLEADGARVRSVVLHAGAGRLPVDLLRPPMAADEILAVDGFEQLSRWQRWRSKHRCRAAGAGLLVTSHASVGLPRLATLAPSLELAQRLARELQAGFPAYIQAEDVVEALRASGDNLREALFWLYDVYEARMRGLR